MAVVLVGGSVKASTTENQVSPRIKYENVLDKYTLTETCNPDCFTVSKTNYTYRDLEFVNGYEKTGESRTKLNDYGYTSVYRVTVNYTTY